MLPNVLILFLCTYMKLIAFSRTDLVYPIVKVAYSFPFVRRNEWHAKKPTQVEPLKTPVPYVVIHHTATPSCHNRKACCAAMRGIQNYHMDHNRWFDIGYNFAVGSDGAVYEGRGWKTTGAHTLYFNSISLGIVLIGNWINEVPPQQQINAAKALLKDAVDLGYLKRDYSLVGHRDVMKTQCPGEAFYKEIQTWPHYLHRHRDDN